MDGGNQISDSFLGARCARVWCYSWVLSVIALLERYQPSVIEGRATRANAGLGAKRSFQAFKFHLACTVASACATIDG